MPIPRHVTETASEVPRESALPRETAAADMLPVMPNAPFLYVHYPDDPGNWRIGTVEGVAYWLPRLQRLSIEPGACGVRTVVAGQDPADAYKDAVAKVEKRGGTYLPRILDYVDRTPALHPATKRRGYLHYDRFETPRVPRGRNKATVKYDQDHEARNTWLLWLISEGYLTAPRPEIVDQNVGRLAGRVYARADRREVTLPADLSKVDASAVPIVITQAMADHETAEGAALPKGAAPRPTSPPPAIKAPTSTKKAS